VQFRTMLGLHHNYYELPGGLSYELAQRQRAVGTISHVNPYLLYADALDEIIEFMRKKYPTAKLYLVGSSYGARLILEDMAFRTRMRRDIPLVILLNPAIQLDGVAEKVGRAQRTLISPWRKRDLKFIDSLLADTGAGPVRQIQATLAARKDLPQVVFISTLAPKGRNGYGTSDGVVSARGARGLGLDGKEYILGGIALEIRRLGHNQTSTHALARSIVAQLLDAQDRHGTVRDLEIEVVPPTGHGQFVGALGSYTPSNPVSGLYPGYEIAFRQPARPLAERFDRAWRIARVTVRGWKAVRKTLFVTRKVVQAVFADPKNKSEKGQVQMDLLLALGPLGWVVWLAAVGWTALTGRSRRIEDARFGRAA
jgi:hypothetical protein